MIYIVLGVAVAWYMSGLYFSLKGLRETAPLDVMDYVVCVFLFAFLGPAAFISDKERYGQ